jgi:phosphomannomutase
MPEAMIKFGTDGWRGEIANDYTFANVRLCAQGFASYLHAKGPADKGVVIGDDASGQGARDFARRIEDCRSQMSKLDYAPRCILRRVAWCVNAAS